MFRYDLCWSESKKHYIGLWVSVKFRTLQEIEFELESKGRNIFHEKEIIKRYIHNVNCLWLLVGKCISVSSCSAVTEI